MLPEKLRAAIQHHAFMVALQTVTEAHSLVVTGYNQMLNYIRLRMAGEDAEPDAVARYGLGSELSDPEYWTADSDGLPFLFDQHEWRCGVRLTICRLTPYQAAALHIAQHNEATEHIIVGTLSRLFPAASSSQVCDAGLAIMQLLRRRRYVPEIAYCNQGRDGEAL